MLSKSTILLFTLVFIFLIMIGGGHTHDPLLWHQVSIPHLEFSVNPDITCNIDGWTFTHHRVQDVNGNITADYWRKKPTSPIFEIKAKAHGFGWAHIILHGQYDSTTKPKKYGHPNNAEDQQMSRWIGFYPGIYGGINHDISVKKYGLLVNNPKPKTYSWSGKGSIKLVPWHWKWGLVIPIPTGSWEPAPKEFHKDEKDESDGSWTVKQNYKTVSSNSGNGNGNNSGDTESGEVTVPDRPGRFTLSPRRIAILLRWEPSDSDGGSPITGYEYQYQSGNYNRRVWSSWSEWTSAGTGNSRSTWITGLNPGVNYGVRMRAKNDEGYSVKTGIVIVKTKK